MAFVKTGKLPQGVAEFVESGAEEQRDAAVRELRKLVKDASLVREVMGPGAVDTGVVVSSDDVVRVEDLCRQIRAALEVAEALNGGPVDNLSSHARSLWTCLASEVRCTHIIGKVKAADERISEILGTLGEDLVDELREVVDTRNSLVESAKQAAREIGDTSKVDCGHGFTVAKVTSSFKYDVSKLPTEYLTPDTVRTVNGKELDKVVPLGERNSFGEYVSPTRRVVAPKGFFG